MQTFRRSNTLSLREVIFGTLITYRLTLYVPGVCYFVNTFLAINSLRHLISPYTEMP